VKNLSGASDIACLSFRKMWQMPSLRQAGQS
jgi:hypothetical protein